MNKIKVIKNLSGHQTARYHIHAGKSVPTVKNSSSLKM